MRRGFALGHIEDIVLLAMEIEALDAACALDAATDNAVLGAVGRHGAVAAVAGLMLALFVRRGPVHSNILWLRLPLALRNHLARLMFQIQPQVAARSLGAENLRVLLAAAIDPELHDAIADALAATLVADSEFCLAALLPAARDKLAVVLAERAGREAGDMPAWIAQLPEQSRARAKMALGFGALLARRGTAFETFSANFSPSDWESIMVMARERAADLGSGSIDMLVKKSPPSSRISGDVWKERQARATSAEETVSHLSGNGAASSSRSAFGGDGFDRRVETDSERATAIVVSARTANASELTDLLLRARRIEKPTWRYEAQNAVLRRALAIGDQSKGIAAGLSRAEIGAAIVVQRLECGETSVLHRSAWTRISADRRFTLLMEVMTNLERGILVATEARLSDVLAAALAMTDAMRDVLVLHLLTNLGRLPCMTDAVLDRLSNMEGQWKDEIFTALARVYALRGKQEKARKLMQLAQSAFEERLRAKAFERLHCLLNDSASIPAEPVRAVMSALATVSAPDLPEAVQMCFERLPHKMSEFVVADVIARGRAVDAFSSAIF